MRVATKVWVLGVVVAQTRGELVAPTRNYVDGECVEGYDVSLHSEVDFFPSRVVEQEGEFRGKVKADYSLHWEVTYHGNYKLLKNTYRDETWVLWQCGTEKPLIEGATAYVEVPVKRVGTTSTTYMPYLEILGEREALKAYTSSFSYVSSPCLRVLNRDGFIREAYNTSTWSPNLNEEEVDVTIADEWSVDSVPKGYSLSDTFEETVFQVAEYVEVVGLFFNREHEANLALERILEAYECLREDIQAHDLTDTKKIVVASYVTSADAFSPGSCPNWYCQVLEDAGGELVEFLGEGEVEAWGYTFMSWDQMAEFAVGADVFISVGPLTDQVADKLMDLLGPNIPIFDNQGKLGADDWFERRLAEPDAVLADFAAALWPGLYTARNFFRDVRSEPAGSKVPDDALDAVCPNPSAPYAWLISAASDCLINDYAPYTSETTNKKTKANLALVVGLAVTLALVVFGILACLFWSHLRQRKRAHTQAKAHAELVPTEVDDDHHKSHQNPTLA